MKHDEIQKILVEHQKYLKGEVGARADLSVANLLGAYLLEANLPGANLLGANLLGANLSRANLSGADLSRANLSGADLSRANLSGADLSRADLSGANLLGANLSRAGLSGAYLSRANLSGAYLSGANLLGAGLLGADLSRAYLSGANLLGADLSGAAGLPSQIDFIKTLEVDDDGVIAYKVFGKNYESPDAWKIEVGAEIFENVNYTRTDDCACGVNVATREWIRDNVLNYKEKEVWRVRIAWSNLIGVCVPYSTDGKFRCERVTLVGIVDIDKDEAQT